MLEREWSVGQRSQEEKGVMSCDTMGCLMIKMYMRERRNSMSRIGMQEVKVGDGSFHARLIFLQRPIVLDKIRAGFVSGMDLARVHQSSRNL
jgi:hypothetical protein